MSFEQYTHFVDCRQFVCTARKRLHKLRQRVLRRRTARSSHRHFGKSRRPSVQPARVLTPLVCSPRLYTDVRQGGSPADKRAINQSVRWLLEVCPHLSFGPPSVVEWSLFGLVFALPYPREGTVPASTARRASAVSSSSSGSSTICTSSPSCAANSDALFTRDSAAFPMTSRTHARNSSVVAGSFSTTVYQPYTG